MGEMTSGEMKFHLQCEALLNTLPEPEFRQLVVEAILVLILVVEHSVVPYLGGIIKVEDIVNTANSVFLADQATQEGDATLCCLKSPQQPEVCGGVRGVCGHFYDSAPSGTFGTMSYLVRASCLVIDTISGDGDVECNMM